MKKMAKNSRLRGQFGAKTNNASHDNNNNAYRAWLLFYGYKDTPSNHLFWQQTQITKTNDHQTLCVELLMQASMIKAAIVHIDCDKIINHMIQQFVATYKDLIVTIRESKDYQRLRIQLDHEFKFIPKYLPQ